MHNFVLQFSVQGQANLKNIALESIYKLFIQFKTNVYVL